MKEKLQQIYDEVNSMKGFDKNTYDSFKKTVVYIKSILENMRQPHLSPMLGIWIEMGINELENEINQKLAEPFSETSKERLEVAYLYSKTTVQLTLNNIIQNL